MKKKVEKEIKRLLRQIEIREVLLFDAMADGKDSLMIEQERRIEFLKEKLYRTVKDNEVQR